jgi:hypothetical protein
VLPHVNVWPLVVTAARLLQNAVDGSLIDPGVNVRPFGQSSETLDVDVALLGHQA